MPSRRREIEPDNGTRGRAVVAAGLIAVAFSLLSARLIYLQVVKADYYEQKAINERLDRVVLPAKRGMISDRFGEILARDQPVSDVYADRFHLEDISVASRGVALAKGVRASDIERTFTPDDIRKMYVERIAEELHRPLGLQQTELLDKLSSGLENKKAEIFLAKGLSDRDSENLEALMDEKQIGGIHMRASLKRYYPLDGRAMHVLGFVNSAHIGQEGIEGKMDDVLGGEDGELVVERDRHGHELAGHRKLSQPVDGSNVTLTIDMRIQDIVEEALDRVYVQRNPEKAIAIVMDPYTGEILAMANRPHFSRKLKDGNRRNYAVADVYEPGSTFKLVTFAGVFDSGLVTPTTSIFCHNGYYDDGVLPKPIRDHHPYGDLTVCGVLAKSSNIGTYKLGRQLGSAGLMDYALRFGFGQKTQIRLTAESSGTLTPRVKWDGMTQYTMGIGYAVNVTPLQMVMATGAIANGGTLMRPMVVRSIEDNSGRTVSEFRPQAIRRVVSQQAANSLRNAMVQVTQKGGTGTKARIEGFRVAGKTGTAKKLKKNPNTGKWEYSNRYVASFVGFVPADAPKFAAIVVIDDPKGTPSECYGGAAAGPVFSEIASRTIQTLGVERPPALVIDTPATAPAGPVVQPGAGTASTRRPSTHLELSPITVAP